MRSKIFLACTFCDRRNYRTSKAQCKEANKKLNLKKYCKFCFKSVVHKELLIK